MAWARVQSKSDATTTTGSPTGTKTVTLGSTPVSGNKILVLIAISAGATASNTVSSVADGNSVALTQAWSKANTNNCWTYLYFYDVPATPSAAITVTYAKQVGTMENAVLVVEFSGLAPGSSLDGSAATISGSATPSTTAGYTSTVANELLVSGFCDFGGPNNVSLSGWTLDPNSVNNNGSQDCVLAWRNSTGGAETSDTWTVGSGDQYAIGTVAFKLAAVAAKPPFGRQAVPRAAYR